MTLQLYAEEELGNPLCSFNAIMAQFSGSTHISPFSFNLKEVRNSSLELLPFQVSESSHPCLIIINSAPLQSTGTRGGCLVSLTYGDS